MNAQLVTRCRPWFSRGIRRVTGGRILPFATLWMFQMIYGACQVVTPAASAPLDRTVTIVLTSRGFHPSVVNIKEGTMALLVQNRSRIRNLTVQVTQDGHNGVALTSQHTASQSDNGLFFTIHSGTYHLSVVEQPSWKCGLNVSAQ